MNVSVDCAPRRGAVFALGRVLLLVACVVAGLLSASPSSASPSSASPSSASAEGAGSRAVTAQPRWSWPVPLPHDVVREFEAPAEKWSPGHRGIDIGVTPGAVVLAPDSGVVHFAGVVVDRPVLSLAHGGVVLSSFEPVVATVAKGDAVERGQPVGVLQPGHCAPGECLHLGARIDGEYVSPLLLLGELRWAVLLPRSGSG